MMKYSILFLLVSLVIARENPFVAAQDLNKTSSISPKIKQSLKLEKISLPSDARVVKEINIKYQSLNGGIYTKTLELDKKVDWHLPIIISHKRVTPVKIKKKRKKRARVKTSTNKILKPFKFMSLKSNKNSLEIFTKDKLIRSFTVPKPYKIVLDFARETSFDKKRVQALSLPFKNFFFGEHRGYYRLVISLDGFYKFKVKKMSKGYRLNLI